MARRVDLLQTRLGQLMQMLNILMWERTVPS